MLVDTRCPSYSDDKFPVYKPARPTSNEIMFWRPLLIAIVGSKDASVFIYYESFLTAWSKKLVRKNTSDDIIEAERGELKGRESNKM